MGRLRFAAPEPFAGSYGGLAATNFSKSCVSSGAGGLANIVNRVLEAAGPLTSILKEAVPQLSNAMSMIQTGEDCLYLNVYKPATAGPSDALPVMFWIYGGSFSSGDGGMYDGTRFVQTSIEMGQPVVVVTHNYRLGPYGFLGGQAAKELGLANSGLKDQRLALQWVADHIKAFGGDPAKVTLFGESAGAMSTFSQMAAYGGDNLYKGRSLFRAAIMQSGSVLPMGNVDGQRPSTTTKSFMSAAGCGDKDTRAAVDCLRSKTVAELQAAQNRLGLGNSFYSWSPHTDYDFFPDHQQVLLRQGRFAKVPFIIGTQEDEATIFSPLQGGPQDDNDMRDMFKEMFKAAGSGQIDQLMTLYPSDPFQGAPFGTGENNNISPNFKRLAAFTTDHLFNAPRRSLLHQSDNVPRWNYFSNALHNIVPIFGTFHANDLVWQWLINLGPYNAYRKYWIAFAAHMDPNPGSDLTAWPKYDNDKKQTLNIGFRNLGVRIDDFRQGSIQYLIDNYYAFIV